MGNEVSQCINSNSQDKSSSKNPLAMLPTQIKKGTIQEDILKVGGQLVESYLKPKKLQTLLEFIPKDIYNFGEKGSGIRAPNLDAIQDYTKIKERCSKSGSLFEDKVFPATQSSLFFSPNLQRSDIKWIRPKELVSDPKFILEGASRFDVCQGELGDCWLLAAIANLTLNDKIFHRVVPQNQSFDGPDYTGAFHFHFWQYGKWIDVVIDDRLPTVNGRLCFMHSKDKNEFWSALLEKAYAKLHGSYEALKGGTATEAMTDFTGGLTEFIELQGEECPKNLSQIILKAHERGSLMGCSIDAISSADMEAELPNGLIRGHAYSITSVKVVSIKNIVQGKMLLIRVRNPWGNAAEWKGAWGDGSREWTLLTEEDKKNLELSFAHDGEFWMSFKDFKDNFTKLEICNLTPEPLDEGQEKTKQWSSTLFDGQWISGVTAGGCRNHIKTFAINPQYAIELVDHDEDDDDDMCTLIVGLMQKNRRAKRKMGLDSLTIGFAIYELKDGHFEAADEPAVTRGYAKRQLLPTEFFQYNKSVARSPNFINLREVSSRVRLPPGKYCIIPSTFDPNEEGEFLLRIFTEKAPSSAEENDDHIGLCEEEEEKNEDDKKNNFAGDKVDEDNIVKEAKGDIIPSPANGDNRDVQPNSALNLIADILHLFSSCWQMNAAPTQELPQPSEAKANVAYDFFARIAGEDMEVDAKELQGILNHALKKEFKFDGFSIDTCRCMVALLDEDRSGKLGLDEFTTLWSKIRHWCQIFHRHDHDNSSTISASELREALHQSGLSVNRHLLNCLILRYGQIINEKKGEFKVERSLTFDSFIHCCLKLKHSIDIWNEAKLLQKAHGSQNPTFSLDEWAERVMYC